MKIYLDTCCLQRPLDEKSQIRVQLEAEAVLAVLTLCASDRATLVSSEVLQVELNKNPNPQRRVFVAEILARAEISIEIDQTITRRAKNLENIGFKGMDALHLAAAEAARVDYFCSCDDRLVKRARAYLAGSMRVVTPLELAEEIIE